MSSGVVFYSSSLGICAVFRFSEISQESSQQSQRLTPRLNMKAIVIRLSFLFLFFFSFYQEPKAEWRAGRQFPDVIRGERDKLS